MKTGNEYKNEWGGVVLILRACVEIDLVYVIDDLLLCDKLSITEFLKSYKPTGRRNTALANLFNDKYFGREEMR